MCRSERPALAGATPWLRGRPLNAPAPKRVRRWAVLLALLAVSAWLALFGDKTPVGLVRPRGEGGAGSAGAPVKTPTSGAATRPVARAGSEPARIEALVSRRSWFEPERPAAADLFARAAWHAPPPAPPPPPPPAPAPVAEAPAPVPLPNYKVAGKQHDGRQWEVFLLRDENIAVVRAGQLIEPDWQVVEIVPPSMTVLHVPSGQQHRIAIGEPL